ncbi:hypothetical protein [Mucisphaera sp.]|uniref:hypothetical protein n=1 Tax=Mucisphaera sp. TaxID=2913024 RepID=UPI003D133434
MREASVTVEELVGASDRAEALEVLAEAFSGHPMVPADPPGRPRYWCARVMMGTMLEVFDKAPGAGLLGVRAEGELACVGFVHDYGYEPKGWDLVKMMWRVVRVLGVARMFEAMRVMSEKHAGGGAEAGAADSGDAGGSSAAGFWSGGDA